MRLIVAIADDSLVTWTHNACIDPRISDRLSNLIPLAVPEVEGQGVTLRVEMRLPQARNLIGMDITNSTHVIISHSGKAGDIGAGIIYAVKY